MKKFILFVLLSLILAMATGTPAVAGDPQNPGKISVVSTIFAPYDFARKIAGEKADISMLLLPGAESHSYEPSPQDIIRIQNSDVFIYVGGETDGWIKRILDSVNTDKKRIIALMDHVELVGEEIVEGMEGGHDHGHSHGHGHSHDDDDDHDDEIIADPHVWTSPRNAKLIVQRIADALCGADEGNAPFYRKNAADYIARLDDLDAAFRAVTDGAKRKTIVFGDRFPFRYLADAYGLEYFAAFPGCSTETEPSARTIAFLIRKVQEEQIPVVFHIELSNERIADTICGESGAKKRLLHSGHNISRDDFQSGASYLELMNRNVEALREALH